MSSNIKMSVGIKTSPTTSALAELDGGAIAIKSSMWDIIEEGVNKDPDKKAVIAMHQDTNYLAALVGTSVSPSGDNLCWSYKQMRLGSSRLASYLAASGVSPGSTLVTLIPNGAEWCLFFWVAMLLEITIVPLDARMVEPPRRKELEEHLSLLKPDCIVVDDSYHISAIEEARSAIDLASPLIGIHLKGESHRNSSWKLLQIIAQHTFSNSDDNFQAVQTEDMTRVVTMVFTSGTSSGKPKACPLTVQNLATIISNNSGLWGMDADRISILHFMNFRIICTIMSLASWHRGATVVIPSDAISAQSSLNAVAKTQATAMLCMPPMLFAMDELIKKDAAYKKSIESVRHVSVGGDVVTLGTIQKMREVFPHAKAFNQHGMTEGCGILSWPHDMDFDDLPTYNGTVSVGTAMPGAKIRIIGDGGEILKRGQVGELHIGGFGCVQRYFGDPRPELFYVKDGTPWIITGDRAVVDEAGWVYVIGRSKDIIKRGGVGIAPAGLEACLNEAARTQVCIHRGKPDRVYADFSLQDLCLGYATRNTRPSAFCHC